MSNMVRALSRIGYTFEYHYGLEDGSPEVQALLEGGLIEARYCDPDRSPELRKLPHADQVVEAYKFLQGVRALQEGM